MNHPSVLAFAKREEPGLLALNGGCKSMVPILGGSRMVDFYVGPPLKLGVRGVLLLTDKDLPSLQDYMTYRYGGRVGVVTGGGSRKGFSAFRKASGLLVLRADGLLVASWTDMMNALASRDPGEYAVRTKEGDHLGYYAGGQTGVERFVEAVTGASRSSDVDALWEELGEIFGEKGEDVVIDAWYRPIRRVLDYVDAHFSLLESPARLSGLLSALPAAGESDGSYIGPRGRVIDSFLSPSCTVNGTVERSILFPNVRVAPGASLRGSIVLSNNYIGEGALVENAVICETSEILSKVAPNIGDRSRIGEHVESGSNERFPDILNRGITLVGENVTVPKACRIARNCYIDSNVDRNSLRVRGPIPAGESVFSA